MEIHGNYPSKFTPVADAFTENFHRYGDIGASFAVYQNRRPVLSLWGGVCNQDSRQPWLEDTLSNVYSCSKGIIAIALAQQITKRNLDYQRPLADYWPEFASNGKQDISVAQVLSHQAGLYAWQQKISTEDLYNWDYCCELLAAQATVAPPGAPSGYHARSFGFLSGELLRRISGQMPGQYIDQFIAQPCQAEFSLGLSADLDNRASTLYADNYQGPKGTPSEALLQVFTNPSNPFDVANSLPWRRAQLPSSNGFASATALAKIYAALGTGLVNQDALSLATTGQIQGTDRVLGKTMHWANGFMLNVASQLGPNDNSFGHTGMGGSMAFYDPDQNIGVAYVMNQMRSGQQSDPRTQGLLQALYQCLG